MFRLIYRQRRRLLFGTFFLMTTGVIQFSNEYPGQFDEMASVSGPAIAWLAMGLTLLLASGVVFAGLALFILIFRRMRMMVEIVPFWLVFNETFNPAQSMVDLFELPAAMTGIISLVILLTFISVTYGVVLDRFRFGLDWKSKRRVRVNRPVEEVWSAFAIAHHGAEPNWNPVLHEARPVPNDPNSFDVYYTMGPSIFQHQRQTVLNSEAPRHYRYRFSGNISAKNHRLTDGEFDVTLEPDGKGGTCVTAFQHNKAMLPRNALELWFDDQLGDALDGFAARLRGKRDWSMTGLWQRKVLSLS